MSIRIITTAVIDCDEPGCEETFYDCVEMEARNAAVLAVEFHKWGEEWDLDPMKSKFFCPKHAKARKQCQQTP